MLAASLVAMVSILMSSPADPAQASPPTVHIHQGELQGVETDGVAAFRAIPYAAPPVGALRWRPPGPAPRWNGLRDAARPGPICIQPILEGDTGVGPLPMSEDCLHLNVWSPRPVQARPVEARGASEAAAPVMVWIHGGGFVNGSGTAALYDGAALARRGVVVVTLNYRLGRLGFFDHPALTAERAPGEAAGNYGLMDIVAALEWVRDNIGAFGGDAGNVTIFGESAGGAAVTRLMIAPTARGLFHRAVVQSGLGRERGVPLDRPGPGGSASIQARGQTFAGREGMAPDADAAALRALDPQALLTPSPSFYGGDMLVIDGQMVAEDVSAAFAAGRQAQVPLIIGANSAELWWVRASEMSAYGQMDDAMTAAECQAFEQAYGGRAAYDALVASDLAFVEPARHLARLHARAGHPTYLYRFDVVSAAMPEPHAGATHASERAYVFDNLTSSSWPTEAMDQAAADAMAGYWTDFAATGDPNGRARPYWPALDLRDEQLLNFDNAGPAARPIPFAERLDLIAAYQARVRTGAPECAG